eukprot:6463361-Amphidinium_carterae.3
MSLSALSKVSGPSVGARVGALVESLPSDSVLSTPWAQRSSWDNFVMRSCSSGLGASRCVLVFCACSDSACAAPVSNSRLGLPLLRAAGS